jgi:uncharacterized phage protein gp47/JayE
VLIKKSADLILKDAINYLEEYTPINNFAPGSIARAILESMNKDFDSLYQYADDVLKMGFISTARGEYLELIGKLFNHERRNEVVYNKSSQTYVNIPIDDERYRYEITQKVLTAANANRESIRLACLAVNGVRDITIIEFSHGIGSFTVFIDPIPGYNLQAIKQQIEDVLEEKKALGIRSEVKLPKKLEIILEMELIFKSNVSIELKNELSERTKNNLIIYFNSLLMGQDFIYNDFAQQVMNVSENIEDFFVKKLKIGNKFRFLVNHPVEADEIISPLYIEVNYK